MLARTVLKISVTVWLQPVWFCTSLLKSRKLAQLHTWELHATLWGRCLAMIEGSCLPRTKGWAFLMVFSGKQVYNRISHYTDLRMELFRDHLWLEMDCLFRKYFRLLVAPGRWKVTGYPMFINTVSINSWYGVIRSTFLLVHTVQCRYVVGENLWSLEEQAGMLCKLIWLLIILVCLCEESCLFETKSLVCGHNPDVLPNLYLMHLWPTSF